MKQFKDINRRPGTKLLKWERAQRYLLAMGFQSIPSKSKHMAFENKEEKIFIGKAGAIRTGKSSSDSRDVASMYWKLIEEWEVQTGKGPNA